LVAWGGSPTNQNRGENVVHRMIVGLPPHATKDGPPGENLTNHRGLVLNQLTPDERRYSRLRTAQRV